MKKAILFIGSIFLCSLASLVLILYFHGRPKTIPGLYSYPPCQCWDPYLVFGTQEAYIAWVEDPYLGVDLIGPCDQISHEHPPYMTFPLDYRYSMRSDGHRMLAVDRMYPLVYLQGSTSLAGEYGILFDSHISWRFLDPDENKYELDIYTGGEKTIASDPEKYTVRQLGDETYYISKPFSNDSETFSIQWFEGNYVATLYITSKKPFEYDAATMDIDRYLSCFQLEFVDLPPLQEKTFPFLWVGITGGICLAAGISLFFVVRKHRNRKKSS